MRLLQPSNSEVSAEVMSAVGVAVVFGTFFPAGSAWVLEAAAGLFIPAGSVLEAAAGFFIVGRDLKNCNAADVASATDCTCFMLPTALRGET